MTIPNAYEYSKLALDQRVKDVDVTVKHIKNVITGHFASSLHHPSVPIKISAFSDDWQVREQVDTWLTDYGWAAEWKEWITYNGTVEQRMYLTPKWRWPWSKAIKTMEPMEKKK